MQTRVQQRGNMRLLAVATLVCIMASAAFAQADDNSKKPSVSVNDVFGRFGFTTSTSADERGCKVTSKIDKNIFLQNVPTLQSLGMFNPDLTTADINTKPTILAATFAMQMAPVVTKETFEDNPAVNMCFFAENLEQPDVYGHTVDNKILSYVFDRTTFDKIDWDQFESTNMPKVSRQFSLDPQVMARMQIENQISPGNRR